MRAFLMIAGLFGLWLGTSVAAEDQETAGFLIAQITAGGANEFEGERHAVEVIGCQLTTYRWKKQKSGEWVLWTSFKVPMLFVDLGENTRVPGTFFIPASTDPELVVILLTAKDGYDLIHEKPFLRKPKGEYTTSPRGDGTTHYYETKNSGVIVQQGPGVNENARMFSTAYRRYRERYCTFIG